jgi:outer membrane murein-binding lipoprotein Lpp
MKKGTKMVLSAVVLAGIFSGCSDEYIDVPFTDTNKVSECIKIDKDLVKVDEFIGKINALPASQVEEYLAALPAPDITNSSEKRPVLRDANARKDKLKAKQQQLGCEVHAKK